MLWLESECSGILSGALPLVLTGDADVAEEVAGVGRSEGCLAMPEGEVRSMLVDIGMSLQYASHLEPGPRKPGESPPLSLSPRSFARVCNLFGCSKMFCLAFSGRCQQQPAVCKHMRRTR